MVRMILLAVFCLAVGSLPARGELRIVNVEAVHGELGPVRDGLAIYGLEELFFRFLLTDIEVDEEGNADIELTRSIINAKGELIDTGTTSSKTTLSLGGGALPGTATLTFSQTAEPGAYRFVVTAKDMRSGEEAEFAREVLIRPGEFAIINPRFSYDAEGNLNAPAGGISGQVIFFRLQTIGFDRSRGKIDLEMKLQTYDPSGAAQMPEPVEATLVSDEADVVAEAPFVTFSGHLLLNRAGEFTLEINVLDRSSGEEVKFTTPFVVRAP